MPRHTLSVSVLLPQSLRVPWLVYSNRKSARHFSAGLEIATFPHSIQLKQSAGLEIATFPHSLQLKQSAGLEIATFPHSLQLKQSAGLEIATFPHSLQAASQEAAAVVCVGIVGRGGGGD